jgi:alpha/beta superfamily hydrolase
MSPVPSKPLWFTGHKGDRLAARLDLTDGTPLAYALFAHCFTCSKDVLAAVRISKRLAMHGISTLRFDFTGLGDSAGDFTETNFSSNLDDLMLATDFLRQHYRAPRLLIGHSFGGAAVLAAAAEIAEVTAVATIAAPSDPSHIAHLLGDRLPNLRSGESIEIQLAGRTFRMNRQFLDDITEQILLTKVVEFPKALIIFHSPQDTVVNIEHAQHIYQAAPYPKSFVSIDDADHMLSRKSDAIYVADVLAAWANRYLADPQHDSSLRRVSRPPANKVSD